MMKTAMILRRLSASFPQPRRLFCSNPTSDFTTGIMELNKEMESIFGEPLSSSHPTDSPTQETLPGTEHHEAPAGPSLTHVGALGTAQMVDVSEKAITKRRAVARCKVILGESVYGLVSANQMGKGDVLGVARLAGISGAKRTSDLIPLCHNIPLAHVRVDLVLSRDDWSVNVVSEATSAGQTGVEMEALTAAAVAGLTVYDMCKAASKGISITELRLESKSGGKSGHWSRDN